MLPITATVKKSGPKAAPLQVTSGSVSAASRRPFAGFCDYYRPDAFALVGPLFTPYDYSVQNLEVVNVPPVMKVYQIPNGDYLYITTALKVISVTPDGKLSGQLRKVRDESDKSMTIFDADGTEVACITAAAPMSLPMKPPAASTRPRRCGTNPTSLALTPWAAMC